jgi:hypothetical protein
MIQTRLDSLPSFFFQNCILLLSSIYTWCNLYKNEEIPCFEFNDKEYSDSNIKKTTFSKMRLEIFEILSSIHSTKNYQSYIKSKKSKVLLSNLEFRIIFEELINPELDYKKISNTGLNISEYILLIMQQMNDVDQKIVLNAINSMDTLAQNYNIYKDKLPPHLNDVIVENFIGIIEKHLKNLKGNEETENIKVIISKIMYCFLNWLMVISIFSKSTWMKIFEILERIYNLPEEENNNEKFNQAPSDPKNKQKLSRAIYSQHEIKISKLFDKKNSADPNSGTQNSFISEKTTTMEDKKNILKTTAEYIINHILHFLGSFPTAYGPSTQESTIVEEDNNENEEVNSNNYIFFSINDTSIITFQELAKKNPLECQNRCIIRNLTGKYVWDSNLFFENLEKVKFLFGINEKFKGNMEDNITDYPINYYNSNISILNNSKVDSFEDEDSVHDIDDDPYHKSLKSPYNENFTYLPKYESLKYTDSEDVVENLLLYISQKYPECLIKQNTYLSDIVPDFPEHQLLNLRSIQKNEVQQLHYERGLNIERRKMIDFDEKEDFEEVTGDIEYDTTYFTRNKFGKETPIPVNSAVFPYQFCRLYMTHTGAFLKQIVDSKKKICMLNNTKALIRDIKGLDKKNGRETIKIGIIYIKLGQETERSIMENENGSDEYNQFVLSLGWEIDLEKHNGYSGGLDKNKTKESKAIYYCDSTLEIIFHDITKFPNDPNDKTHIKKKRHIGNDQIHIIWNEHNRDYRSRTIGGDFGNIQIIITPLRNGLYSVYVRQDDMNIILGPLSETMLVSKYALGPLVRATAIYAYRQVVYQEEIMYYHPYNQRLDNIKTIISRHKNKNFTYDSLLNSVFLSKDDANSLNSTTTITNTIPNINSSVSKIGSVVMNKSLPASVNSTTANISSSNTFSSLNAASTNIQGMNALSNSNDNNNTSNSNNSCNSIKNKDGTMENSNQDIMDTPSSLGSNKIHMGSTPIKSISATLKKKRNISTTAIDSLILENEPIAACDNTASPLDSNNNGSGSNYNVKDMRTTKSTLFA